MAGSPLKSHTRSGLTNHRPQLIKRFQGFHTFSPTFAYSYCKLVLTEQTMIACLFTLNLISHYHTFPVLRRLYSIHARHETHAHSRILKEGGFSCKPHCFLTFCCMRVVYFLYAAALERLDLRCTAVQPGPAIMPHSVHAAASYVPGQQLGRTSTSVRCAAAGGKACGECFPVWQHCGEIQVSYWHKR